MYKIEKNYYVSLENEVKSKYRVCIGYEVDVDGTILPSAAFTQDAYKKHQELNKLEEKDDKLSLLDMLKNTDYKVLKRAEGYYTEKEWEDIKQERENIRIKIRKIEKKGD